MSLLTSSFEFTPSPASGLRAAAFPLVLKLLASTFALGSVLGAAVTIPLQAWGSWRVMYAGGWLWFLAGTAIVLWMTLYIWISHTTLTRDHLAQSWIWHKEVLLGELSHIRILRVPGLDWLVAPRVYAHTLNQRFTVLYVADHQMLSECERMQRELALVRKLK